MKRREFLRGAAIAGGSTALRIGSATAQAPVSANRDSTGKFVERFSAEGRARSGMALGGIGAGYFEIRKDGRFYAWNIANNFPKETGPKFLLPDDEREDRMEANLFFEVRYQVQGESPRIKLLQLSYGLYEGAEMGIAYSLPWMKAIREIEYSARFPLATLVFRDPEMPFSLKLEAWSSFIPHDVKNSALPLIFFDFEAESTCAKPVNVTLLMTARNFTGYADEERFYTTVIDRDSKGLTISMSSGGMDRKASSWGEIALGVSSPNSSFYAGWGHRHPYYEQVLRRSTLPNLDDTNGRESIGNFVPDWLPDTTGRNRVDPQTGVRKMHDDDLFSTIACTFKLQASGENAKSAFQYAWNFPNLYNEVIDGVGGDRIEGHFYSNFFSSAAAVIAYGSKYHRSLKQSTMEFLNNFFASDGEVALLEQANSQLNTFFTSGRLTRDGSFGVLEGLSKSYSWGPIATIDVMLYGTAPIIALFPELQKATMRCHALVQLPSGEIEHGLRKDFLRGEDSTTGVSHRIDLPGQFAIMVMRDFFWTNDMSYLRELFPAAQRAVEYVLRDRSAGNGAMPVTQGIETSYDNFSMTGFASYLLSQWICALESVAAGAAALDDTPTSARYLALAGKTRETMETKLWNGSYYKLYAADQKEPATSNGDGCLTDQLVGQWAARCSGLSPILQEERIGLALKSILTRSYHAGFGLQNCSFRTGEQLSDVDRDIWNDQANTCWSGVELAFASLLMFEGLYEEGVMVARTVDTRYRENGLYWNHQEYGGHYFRPMSAWSLVNAMLGFSINCDRMTFDPKVPQLDLQLFFATPTGTAFYRRSGKTVQLRCLTGQLAFREVWLGGVGPKIATIEGRQIETNTSRQGGLQSFSFATQQKISSGQTVTFS
ncbi:GH116 family glycosyl hydrolase [Tunturiibacter empetritectus]